MSNLPAKPEFSRTARAWPEAGDDRRPGGPGRASPEKYSHQRDDRDRDRDARDRERGSRSRYTPSGQRSPLPPRSVDTYISSARDPYHGREYRGYDDARARDDRRKDWDRERDRDRDRDRDRGYYRRDNAWAPRNEYSPNRPTSARRGYSSRESDWRGRDDYRRERNRERGRSRDRDDQRPRDREHDRRRASPTYRPAPLSPRHDHHHEAQPLPRRVQPLCPSRGRRSTSAQSTGSRSRRSSLLSRVRPEPVDTQPPRDIPRGPKSPSSRRGGPSPSRCPQSVSSPTRTVPERPSPETAGRQLYHLDVPSGM
ncbi:hypothetical protein J3R82DRAFT_5414 [Butyriboletus roseoflavus]|nr:hypothetical protein J3R82DRAFT_5414 [Butyriboletus roseoflavus]